MTTKDAIPRPIEILPGVRPITEGTTLTTPQWTASYGIRFKNGYPQKVGGFDSITFDYNNQVIGICRSIFSTILNGITLVLLGTHKRLYSIYGSTLTNITPLKTSATAAANSLATFYGTLANNPITTINGSKVLTIADASGGRLRAGDSVVLSGASTTNGVPDTDINATQVIRSVAANGLSYTIIVSTAATSSGSGGGASVVRKTGLLRLNKTAHGMADGDRTKIAAAADTGGILAAAINLEFIIRYIDANNFDFMTASVATSSVSAAGGGSTTFQPQIDAGLINTSSGVGYGMGKYGVGLYGSALRSTASQTLARIWFFAAQRFSSVVIFTAGNQTGLYEWNGSTVAAPVLVANAPTTINYCFISDNIVVTFGNVNENRIKTSDQGDRTNWTSSSTNQVFVDDIEGAGRFISHANANGVNLIFTPTQCYTMRYIGGQAVWEIKEKSLEVGLIGPMARVVVNGIVFWQGQNNFYMWRGAAVEIIPANTQAFSTILNYVFENMNRAQAAKNFAVHNEKFNEVEFHYCSADSDEPNSVARVNLYDFSWCPDEIDRTAAEYPVVSITYPMMIDSGSTLYFHDKTVNADGAALPFSITSNDQVSGKNNATIVSFVPDSIQTGSITVNVKGKRFPQSSANTFNKNYTVTPTTERVPTTSSARIWKYTISGNVVDQTWAMGQWTEELKEGAAQ